MLETTNGEKTENIRDVIKNIWYRARINAFAHKFASKRAARKAATLFVGEVIMSLLGILAVLSIYIVSSGDNEAAIARFGIDRGIATIVATFSSITFTVIALFLSVLANYMKYEIAAGEHKNLLGMYQYLAQRAREVNWPDMEYKKAVSLLEDLERDFQLLKAKGEEPDDCDFDAAHGVFHKIRINPETEAAQSFDMSEVIEEKAHAQLERRRELDQPGRDMLGAS